MVMQGERAARESEALRRVQPEHLMPESEPQFPPDLAAAVTDARYTLPEGDPQWLPAWRMLLDPSTGQEYGIPVMLPRGQWDQGGPNALNAQRRPDGGYHFQLTEPANKAPQPEIECIYDKCGDADRGGRRKMMFTVTDLIEHVETFHTREARVYRKYLDEIADNMALNNTRLQKLRTMARGTDGVSAAPAAVEAFYCEAGGCSRFFDSEAGRAMHMRRDHKEA